MEERRRCWICLKYYMQSFSDWIICSIAYLCNIIPSLSRTWCKLTWSCSSTTYIIRLNCSSWKASINGTELLWKGFPLIQNGTRSALNGYSQKELAQFDLELELFIFNPEQISPGGDGKKTGAEAWNDPNTTNGDEWKPRYQKMNLL